MNAALHHWLTLTLPGKLHGRQIETLLAHSNQNIENLFPQIDQLAAEFNFTSEFLEQLKNPVLSEINIALRWLEEKNHHFIHWQHPDYPELLRNIPDPPACVYVKGNPKILRELHFAIVGSRYPTPHGIEMAEIFAAELAEKKLVICSGLALGIDAASHRGALRTGTTTAVLGNGLMQIYPYSNRKLADHILEKSGAILSEFPLTAAPLPYMFPLRNRLISGLSIGTLVVEAALQSGSLITARYAGEQGREIFAIPGSPFSPLSKGCHQLIQQGAKLTTCADDILQEFPRFFSVNTASHQDKKSPPPTIPLEKSAQRLLECVAFAPTSVDRIIDRSGFRADIVAATLLQLELSGHITRTAGGYTRLRN